MIIKANNPTLVLRYTQFQRYSFIKEHEGVIKKEGYTWMLKTGRKIPLSSLNNICQSGGFVVLKAPKKAGGMYHIAVISEYKNGMPDTLFKYPEYYKELTNETNIHPLEGTWLRVDRIIELPSEYIENLLLCRNHNKVVDVISATRTSVMYAYFDIDVIIKD